MIQPLRERLALAARIDRQRPPDPQRAFSHGQVLRGRRAARWGQPTALVHIPAWAERTGADILGNLPADRRHNDRLGRALETFFDQRHAILARATAQALPRTALPLEHRHVDTTPRVVHGAYDTSPPRPSTAWAAWRGDAPRPPAPIGPGERTDAPRSKVGVSAAVNAPGALPVCGPCRDGARQERRAVREPFQLLPHHLPVPDAWRMISDRGPFAADPVARRQRQGDAVVCYARGDDCQAIADAHAERRPGQEASDRSIDQRRRRATAASRPRAHDRLAVRTHALTDPRTGRPLPGRLILVPRSADAKGRRQRRAANIAKIRAGLEALTAQVPRGHVRGQPETLRRPVERCFGQRAAARSVHGPLETLTAAPPAARPRPAPGPRRPRDRFPLTFDEAGAQAAARDDGLAVLDTTAPRTRSADARLTPCKRPNVVALRPHPWTTPWAVRSVVRKSPRRVEALGSLRPLAVPVDPVVERRDRQTIGPESPLTAPRRTAASLRRPFPVCGLIVHRAPVGRVGHATAPTRRPWQNLRPLGFPTPAQPRARNLHPDPTGRVTGPDADLHGGCGKSGLHCSH